MRLPPSALPGISPTRGEIGCGIPSFSLDPLVSIIAVVDVELLTAHLANLPPGGGDARQGRGG